MAGGFVIYTYSGEADGYTLSRAVKEVWGDRRRLVEIEMCGERMRKQRGPMIC